ncbi:MAG: UDP-glucose 4-epimerase [Myxococcota bacterium]|jgi:UDP-glucose 4-epimerase
MKILVTGGAGYIGSVVTAQLIAAGHAVVVVDNLSTGHRAAVAPEATFVACDVADSKALTKVFETHGPFDAAMHFAAKIIVSESMTQPMVYLRDNLASACTLIDCAARFGVRRLVASSTAAVYGAPTTLPIVEDTPYAPTSAYGQSKIFMEQALAWAETVHGIRYAALRYMNACGATESLGEDHHPETHLIPNVLKVATGERETLYLFGDDWPTPDGTCVRDYVHVLDIASAHIRALEALGDADESLILNVGTGRGTSIREIIEAARRVTGHPIPVEVAPRRAGDPPTLYASVDRIEHRLDWRAEHSDIDTIVGSAWKWHSAHPGGYLR